MLTDSTQTHRTANNVYSLLSPTVHSLINSLIHEFFLFMVQSFCYTDLKSTLDPNSICVCSDKETPDTILQEQNYTGNYPVLQFRHTSKHETSKTVCDKTCLMPEYLHKLLTDPLSVWLAFKLMLRTTDTSLHDHLFSSFLLPKHRHTDWFVAGRYTDDGGAENYSSI